MARMDASGLELQISPKKSKEQFVNPGDSLIVSSTSWTADEDFGVLFEALKVYDSKPGKYPTLCCVITGKGPQKQMYTKQFTSITWNRVKIKTCWLEKDDYPKLLACADFGISLHTSSSGLDLPMKVVDMFGCAIPVMALNFEALEELVVHGKKYLN
jgi:beta-1,4-mannosyltransferase